MHTQCIITTSYFVKIDFHLTEIHGSYYRNQHNFESLWISQLCICNYVPLLVSGAGCLYITINLCCCCCFVIYQGKFNVGRLTIHDLFTHQPLFCMKVIFRIWIFQYSDMHSLFARHRSFITVTEYWLVSLTWFGTM